MLQFFLFIGVLFAAGIAATVSLWSFRARPGVRRFLKFLWIGIGLTILATPFVTLLNIWTFGQYAYNNFLEVLQTLHVPAHVGNLIAIAAGGLAGYAGWLLLWGNKRVHGLWIIGTLAILFIVVASFWGSKNGYVVQLNGRIRRCTNPGGIDPGTMQRCQTMTAPVLRLLRESHEQEPLVLEEHPEDCHCFDIDTGEAIRWFCDRGDGILRFARVLIYDPFTGRQCTPVTLKLAQRCQREKAEREQQKAAREEEEARKRAKQEVEEVRKRAEAERREEERRRTEETQHAAEEARQAVARQQKREREKREAAAARALEVEESWERHRQATQRKPRTFTSSRPVVSRESGESTIEVSDEVEIKRVVVSYRCERGPEKISLVRKKRKVSLCTSGWCREYGNDIIVTDFDGESSNGQWTLRVEGGQWLESWSITFTPVVDAQGLVVRPTSGDVQPDGAPQSPTEEQSVARGVTGAHP